MDIDDRVGIKAVAGESIARNSRESRNAVLLHTGIILALSLVIMLISEFLSQQIEHTGGLGGLGKRTLLGTIQSVLQFSQIVALPFWQIGYTYVTIRIARRQGFVLGDLAEGFRHFGPVLRLTLLQAVLYMGIIALGSNIGSIVFLFTPWAKPLWALLVPASASGTLTDEMILSAVQTVQVPIAIVMGLVCLLLAAPFFYQYRMAQFYLIEHPEKGALKALRSSSEMSKYLRFSIFRLDLSFWYFYLLDLLVSALGYGDQILALLGISLPWNSTALYFGAFILYAVCQLGLYLWKRNHVGVAMAHMYMLLNDSEEPEPPKQPKKQVWNY